MPTISTGAEADRRFLQLRDPGFTGPIDPETGPAILATVAGLDEATTRLLAARATGEVRHGW